MWWVKPLHSLINIPLMLSWCITVARVSVYSVFSAVPGLVFFTAGFSLGGMKSFCRCSCLLDKASVCFTFSPRKWTSGYEWTSSSHCICANTHKHQRTLISVIFLRLFSLSSRKNSPVASCLSICAEEYFT